MGGLLFLAICIGMAVDSSNIGYDGDDVPGFAPEIGRASCRERV